MTIIITSKRNGFRRCGVAHPDKPTPYPDEFFTEEQLEALSKEPQLILAYAEDGFDLVKDLSHETDAHVFAPQTPDAMPSTQPQAPETVLAPVVAPVVDAQPGGMGNDPSGPAVVEPVADAPNSGAALSDSPQPQADNVFPAPQDAAPAVKPEKSRTSKAKDDSK